MFSPLTTHSDGGCVSGKPMLALVRNAVWKRFDEQRAGLRLRCYLFVYLSLCIYIYIYIYICIEREIDR